MEFTHNFSVRDVIENENIYENTVVVFHMLVPCPAVKGVVSSKAGVSDIIVRVCPVLLKKESVGVKLGFADIEEFFVILPEHNDVYIIIPRDKPAVTDRA